MKECKTVSLIPLKIPTAKVDKNELRSEIQTSLDGNHQGEKYGYDNFKCSKQQDGNPSEDSNLTSFEEDN